jgi:hypothetical protein
MDSLHNRVPDWPRNPFLRRPDPLVLAERAAAARSLDVCRLSTLAPDGFPTWRSMAYRS